MDNKSFNYNSVATTHDKELINYTIKEYMKLGYESFSSYRFNYTKKQRDSVYLNIDKLFYSSDSLKFIGWIVRKEHHKLIAEVHKINFKKYDKNGYVYDGVAIVGIRNSLNKIWKIYLFNWYSPCGFDSYEKVTKLFNNYFFKEIADHSAYAYNKQRKWEAVKFQYTLDNIKFWKGPIFDTSMYEGYSLFQIKNFASPETLEKLKRKRDTISLPIIKYPDFILNYYK